MNLAELIRTTKGDRSYDDLARAAGGAPGRQRWQQLASNVALKNFPDPESIRAIARALGVTQRAVVDAAAESLGLEVRRSRSRFEELLPDGVDDLDDDALAGILAVLRALARAEGAPTTKAAVQVTALHVATPAQVDDVTRRLMTLNPAASDAEDGTDPDDEVEEQQNEP